MEETTAAAMTAKVPIFMPPATDPAAPPINIKLINNSFVSSLIPLSGIVAKPAVLPLMERKSD